MEKDIHMEITSVVAVSAYCIHSLVLLNSLCLVALALVFLGLWLNTIFFEADQI